MAYLAAQTDKDKDDANKQKREVARARRGNAHPGGEPAEIE